MALINFRNFTGPPLQTRGKQFDCSPSWETQWIFLHGLYVIWSVCRIQWRGYACHHLPQRVRSSAVTMKSYPSQNTPTNPIPMYALQSLEAASYTILDWSVSWNQYGHRHFYARSDQMLLSRDNMAGQRIKCTAPAKLHVGPAHLCLLTFLSVFL